MKKITVADLPNPLNEEIVFLMMQMEQAQSPEWEDLSMNLPFDIEKQYFQIKAKIQKDNYKPIEVNWDNEHLAFLSMYVNRGRHYTDYTIEDIIEMTLNKKIYSREKLIEIFVEGKQIDYILARQVTINSNEKFSFFWSTISPFSQWHKSKFKATTFINEDRDTKAKVLNNIFPLDEQEYSSVEQFMMYNKAMIFLDREIAQLIMKTDDVRKIKELGRKVKNYDEDIWKYFRSKVIYEGNKAKFIQNKNLQEILLSTKGTTLVEASPNDVIWGIGLTENDERAMKRETWLGKNLLGEILTLIRVELMGEY